MLCQLQIKFFIMITVRNGFLLLFLAYAIPSYSQLPDSSSALNGMREAELTFARESAMLGRKEAFVRNFAEESVLFTDKWITNGKEYSQKRENVPVILKWEPEYMDISTGGDFGISTGPWEAQEFRPGTAPLSTGYFLTVWKKINGQWKVILDGGSATPPPAKADHGFSFPEGADSKSHQVLYTDITITTKKIISEETRLLKEWSVSYEPAAYLKYLEKDARSQHSGHLPTTSVDTIRTWLGQQGKSLEWKISGCGASPSGDIGYTYGMLIHAGTEKTAGHYVRIWKKQPDSGWKITVEMLNSD
jgi:ketosteroid isomerase-like protein